MRNIGLSSAAVPAISSAPPVTMTMRALHRLDGLLPFQRQPLRNTTPILSLAFDDVPDSAVAAGVPVLEAAGVRGTFFVATGLIGRSTEAWRQADAAAIAALHAGGHEIGLHSHSHAPAARLGRCAFADDLALGREELRALLPGATLDNYALPFGFAHPLHRACLKRETRSCRTTHPGLNAGTVDPYRLLSHAIGAGLRDNAHVDRLLDDAVAGQGWLILTLHDIGPAPSPYGCTRDTLARTIDCALARGLRIRTVSEALDACGMPARSAGFSR